MEPHAGEASHTNETKQTILVVEDDPFVLSIYRSRLQREGCHVESAEDGLAAINMLPQVRAVWVVLNLLSPRLHGAEVLNFIRADAPAPAC